MRTWRGAGASGGASRLECGEEQDEALKVSAHLEDAHYAREAEDPQHSQPLQRLAAPRDHLRTKRACGDHPPPRSDRAMRRRRACMYHGRIESRSIQFITVTENRRRPGPEEQLRAHRRRVGRAHAAPGRMGRWCWTARLAMRRTNSMVKTMMQKNSIS